VQQGLSAGTHRPTSVERLSVGGQIVRQEFQRDVAAEVEVFGFIDHAHPSTAQLF